MAPLDARYVTVKWWDEEGFRYQETVIHLGRSKIDYDTFKQEWHKPPLSYVGKQRVL